MKATVLTTESNKIELSARGFSPTGLHAIQGQDHVLHFLRKAISEGRLHHGLLFEGPQGVGKAACARSLFAALNCHQPPALGETCGACVACHKIQSGNHPDWIQIGDQTTGLAEQIEALIGRVGRGPHEGSVQFVLIDPAEVLSSPNARVAANRLLKILEEPPPRTHFVLVANNAFALLPTLRSRLQRIRFLPLSDATLKQIFAQKAPDSVPSEQQLQLSHGSMEKLVSMLTDADAFNIQQALLERLLAAGASGNAELIVAASGEKTFQDKALVLQMLDWLSGYLAMATRRQPEEAGGLCQLFRHVQEARTAVERATAPALALERLLFSSHPMLSKSAYKEWTQPAK